jgi:membrane-bound metal-dependent hydrolase YbcI (DUF457 family)
MHSLLALFCVGVIALPLFTGNAWAGVSLLLGYGSHLAGDACTKRGVPLFYFVSQRSRRAVHLLPRSWCLSTGSLAEEGIFVVVAMGAMALLLRVLFREVAL